MIFTVSAGAVLDLTGLERTVRYGGTYTGSGAGTIRVRAGVLQVGAAGATFNFPPGLFQWTGGIIGGGTAGLTNAGSISLAGTDDKFLSGLLNNVGTSHTRASAICSSAALALSFSGPDGTFNNLAGGLYDLGSDVRLANGVFNNAGTLRKTAGTGDVYAVQSPLQQHRWHHRRPQRDVSVAGHQRRTLSDPYRRKLHGCGRGLPGPDQRGWHPGLYGKLHRFGRGVGSNRRRLSTRAVRLPSGPGERPSDFPPGLLHWIGGVIDAREAPFTNRGTMTVDVDTTVGFNPFVRFRGTLNNAGTIVHVETASFRSMGTSV